MLSLPAKIARTHLLAKRKQTIIASLGVTFGIAMFILMITVMTGVNKLLEETTLTSSPHIRIYNDIDIDRASILDEQKTVANTWNIVRHMKAKEEQLNLKNGLLIVDRIRKQPGVTGVSAQLTSQVFYNNGPTQITGTVAGVNILHEDKLYQIKNKIRSGSIEAFLAGNDVILMGEGLAKKLNVRTGDKVTVATPTGQTKLLRIAGIYRFGIGAIDNMRSYASIKDVQKIMGKGPDYITEIHVKLDDLYKAREVSESYQSWFGYKAEDWETANATILVSFTIRNIMTYLVVVTLLVVAGFGIYNIMNMTIVDKMKDIAILKATGFESREIILIFLLQAVFIGLIGGTVGLVFGFLLSYAVSKAPFDGGEFLSIDTFPVNIDPKFFVFGMLFGIVTTILAGYFPSRKAAQIDPVQILRG